MTTTPSRIKMLRQHLRLSMVINELWEDYNDGLFTKKEIIDSLFIVLNDKNKPNLRLRMLENQKRWGELIKR